MSKYERDIILSGIQGPWTDVRAYASLATAVAAIGSEKQTLLIPNECEVSSDLTIPSNIALEFIGSGSLNNSATLTVQTTNIKSNSQIFGGSGTYSFATGTQLNLSWFGSLSDAIDYIGSDEVDLFINNSITISSDLTIPSNITLHFAQGSKIEVSSGATVTINGPIIPKPGIFDGSGKVELSERALRAGYVDSSWFADGLVSTLKALDGLNAEVWVTEDATIDEDLSGEYNLSGVTVVIRPGVTVTADTESQTIDFNIKVQDGGQFKIDEDITVEGNLISEGYTAKVVAFDAVDGDETLTINGNITGGPWKAFSDNVTLDGNYTYSFYRKRPAVSSKNLTYYIDPDNGDDNNDGLSIDSPLKTIQEFADRLPFVVLHDIRLDLLAAVGTTPVTYDEHVRIDSIIGSGPTDGNENLDGNLGNVRIFGDIDDPSKVRLKSFAAFGCSGVAVPRLMGVTMYDTSIYNDEGCSIVFAGGSEGQVWGIAFEDTVVSGILGYCCNVNAREVDVTNIQQRGFYAKRGSIIQVHDTKGTFDPDIGSYPDTSQLYYATESSEIFFSTIHSEPTLSAGELWGVGEQGYGGSVTHVAGPDFVRVHKKLEAGWKIDSAASATLSSDFDADADTDSIIPFDQSILDNFKAETYGFLADNNILRMYTPGIYRITLSVTINPSGFSNISECTISVRNQGDFEYLASKHIHFQESASDKYVTHILSFLTELPEDYEYANSRLEAMIYNKEQSVIPIISGAEATRFEMEKIG